MLIRIAEDPKILHGMEFCDGPLYTGRPLVESLTVPTVRWCTLLYLMAMIRLAFERRNEIHYVGLHYRPHGLPGIRFEGAVLDTWVADGDGDNAVLGFTVARTRYNLRVDEFVELQTPT